MIHFLIFWLSGCVHLFRKLKVLMWDATDILSDHIPSKSQAGITNTNTVLTLYISPIK